MGETPLRKQTKQKSSILYKSVIIIFILALIDISIVLILNNVPYFQRTKINTTTDTQIYYMGEKINYNALIEDEQLYLPYKFVKEYIDPTIEWDEKTKLAIITTDKDVFHFPLGKRDGYLNLEPYSFTYPLIEFENEIYLPIEPLNDYYDFEVKFYEENSLVIIYNLGIPIQQGIVLEQTKLREKPTLMSPWVENIFADTEVNVMREENEWYWVETSDGNIGYINKDKVRLTQIKTTKIEKDVYQPWNPIGKPVVLTWEYATQKTTKTDKIGNLQGVQAVSPTWFHLQKNGLVSNTADLNYVEWAHKNGYQVWGLFSNSFDLDLTHEMLSDPNLRMKVIKQLLSYVDLYKLDGINIDFENVYVEDKDLLVQFIRELTPLMHEKDRVVSIDVTFKSKSENWSMFYDRKKLGEIVDYVIVMAYDEHWASSPVAGSVASLPWVEKGIKGILEEVPSDKVILGVPFYTRLWTEEKDENGNKTVTSKALSMNSAKQWIKDKNAVIQYDNKSGQNYVEVTEGNITYKMWLEDEVSMEKRINLMKKYRLAGIAGWRRGFESDDFWMSIEQSINQRP